MPYVTESQVFEADTKAAEESKVFRVLGLLPFIAGRQGQRLATEINNDTLSAGDYVAIYDDRLEKKTGQAIVKIFYKDIASLHYSKSPSGKLLFFHINETGRDTIIVGVKDMDGLLATIAKHVPPSNIFQHVVGNTVDGKKALKKLIITLIAFFIMYILLDLLLARLHS